MLPAYLLFGLGISLMARELGKRDDQSKVRYGLVIRYVLTPTVIVSLVCVAWIIGWQRQNVGQAAVYLAVVLLTGLIAWGFSKNRIKGSSKDKLFQ